MKRIVQCPQCESKLAFFDVGKDITQKCPRCGHAFEILSEIKKEPKSGDKKKAKAAAAAEAAPEASPAPAAEAKPDETPAAPAEAPAADKPAEAAKLEAAPEKPAAEKPAEAKPEEKPAAAADTTAEAKPGAAPAEKKEITLKKPLGRPAGAPARPASPAPESAPAPEAPAHGVSFLHIVVLFALLILTIIFQVISQKKTSARLENIENAIITLQTPKK